MIAETASPTPNAIHEMEMAKTNTKKPPKFGGFVLWMHLCILEINTYYASFFLPGQGFVLFFMHISDNSPVPFLANSLNCASV